MSRAEAIARIIARLAAVVPVVVDPPYCGDNGSSEELYCADKEQIRFSSCVAFLCKHSWNVLVGCIAVSSR